MKIVTDSAADLPVEDIIQYDLVVAPLYIQFPEGGISSDEITPDEFYDRLKGMVPKIPTTSQPSSGAFSELYKKIAKAGEEIISLHISSGLSGTIESARLAAKNLSGQNITLVDTMTLSGAERFQVLAAAMAAKAGWTKTAIMERLDQIRESTEIVYTLETLEYLARGGRIGRVQALAGSLLKLKPIIHVEKADGKYSTVGKERTIPRALGKITEFLHEKYGSSTPMWVSVLHGQLEEQAHNLAENLKEKLNVSRLEVLRVSPVLGVHTGPGVVGAAVVPHNLMEID